jgi:hypothetical protein
MATVTAQTRDPTRLEERADEIARSVSVAHPVRAALRTRGVSSGLILLLVLAVPYMTLNLVRLVRGRRWALTFCQVMREWEATERIKHAAARAADDQSRPPPATKTHR